MTLRIRNRHASHEGPSLQTIQARRTPENAQRTWRAAAGRVQLSLGRRLDPGMVLEKLLVQLDEVLPLIGRLVFRENRLHRAHRLTGAAVDAFVRMDVEHRVAFVDAIHRTHLDAGLVLYVDARLGNDVRHLSLRSLFRGAFSSAEPPDLVPESAQCVKHSGYLPGCQLLGLQARVERIPERVA